MKNSLILGVLAVFLIVAILFFSAPTNASSSWIVQPISDSSFAPNAIVVDSQDRPHIAYTQWVMGNPHNKTTWSPRDGLDSVIYSSWNGTIWTNQTVATDAAFVDMSLDSHDNAHILFKSLWGMTDQRLMYAVWTGNNWNIQDTGAQGTYDASLVLDSSDNPHIAFIDFNGETGDLVLKYASLSGSSWNTQIVDSTNISFTCDLKLDSQNNPHIMYETNIISRNASDQESVKYAFYSNSSGWISQNTIQVPDQNIEFSNIVLDQNDYPYFSYGNNVVNWNGSGWSVHSFSSVFNSSVSYGGCFLTLDKQNHPCLEVIVGKDYASELVYLRWSGTNWNTQSVYLNPEYVGPLTLDSKDNPHMLFYRGVPGGAYPPLISSMYATSNGTITNLLLQSFLHGQFPYS